MADRLLYLLLGAAVGAFAFQSCGSPELPSWPEVVVPAARIIELEPPDRPPTIVERVVYRNIGPAQLASSPGGALEELASFCRPVVVSTVDTVEVADPQLLLRSGSWDDSWWGSDELVLTGFTNAGDLRRYVYHPRGGFDFRTSGDSILVRSGRFNLIRDAWELGAQGWTAYSLLRALLEAL